MIINVSEELTFRDYKKSLAISETKNIPISFIESYESQSQINEGISFVSFKNFSLMYLKLSLASIPNLVVVADEFDQIIFGECE
jgi:hypothetical protein